MRKIALVTCASSFERYSIAARAIRAELARMGGCVLYVISNYNVYVDGMDFIRGDAAIYSLLDSLDLDGCIIDFSLGSNELAGLLAGRLSRRGIPALTINLEVPGVPYLHLETREAGMELAEHLISGHGCRRINLVLNHGNSVVCRDALDVFRESYRKHGIEWDERRVLMSYISVQDGRTIYDRFAERGVMEDAQAVVCVHDVCAIGLYMELKDRGIRVPEDVRICSMNFSGNSVAFEPQITGIDRRERKAAEAACHLICDMIDGKPVSGRNTYSGEVRYGASCCGGGQRRDEADGDLFRSIVINKVEAGKQIGQMMRFNDALEEVESPDQLAANVHEMMEGLGSRGYFCCLNKKDLAYIENRPEGAAEKEEYAFDENMLLLAGFSERTGRLTKVPFRLEEICPAAPAEGDLFLIMPITHRHRVFGYMVLLNDEMPFYVYNYRICQENIGSSIENLHRQMVLRSSIAELDRLHMQDQLTGLFNRFALKRFSDSYVKPEGYTTLLIDMDGLKGINDGYGHLAGNYAISLVGQTIRKCAGSDDLVIRYGGDEFLVLSRNTDPRRPEEIKAAISRELENVRIEQGLPYAIGVSVGWTVSGLPLPEAVETADRKMYAEKQERKAKRKE